MFSKSNIYSDTVISQSKLLILIRSSLLNSDDTNDKLSISLIDRIKYSGTIRLQSIKVINTTNKINSIPKEN